MTVKQPKIEELLSQHTELREHAARLESLVAGDRPIAALGAELAAVEKILARHFQMEEMGGYMSFVLEAAPEEEERLRRLRGDHDDLWGRLRQLRGLVDRGAPREELRPRIDEWLGLLRSHETAEHRLIERHANVARA